MFFNIIDKNFPKYCDLRKTINKITVMISYSCTDMLENKIKNTIKKQIIKNFNYDSEQDNNITDPM